MKDQDIDLSDVPELTAEFFANAQLRLPDGPVRIGLKVDSDVLAWFMDQGDDWRARMNAALRMYAAAHRAILKKTDAA
jgi:hypothetical protein